MKVKVTKKMVSELNKALKKMEATSISKFEFKKIDYNMGGMLIGNVDDNDLDFDDTGRYIYKTIKVSYKDECYAYDRYMTSKNLIDIFRRNYKDGYYLAQFIDDVIFELEI